MAWTDRYRREDERVWRELMDRAMRNRSRGTDTTDAQPADDGQQGNGQQEYKHDRPYDDENLGRIAYDQDGKLLKPAKPSKPKRKPLSRNLKAGIWKTLGGIAGTALAGGVGGTVGSMLFDPRFRHNAIEHGEATAYTQPIPRAEKHDHPLDEPFDKDGDKTLSQKFMSKAEELQVGKGRQDYRDDFVWDRDSGKWIPADAENESIRSVITEALKQFRSKI